MDRSQVFVDAFLGEGGDEIVGTSRLSYLAHFLDAVTLETAGLDAESIDEIAWSFESLAVTASRTDENEARVAELADVPMVTELLRRGHRSGDSCEPQRARPPGC
jgi:hypothetical protein